MFSPKISQIRVPLARRKSLRVSLSIFAVIFSADVLAFNMVVTEEEYQSWPRHCQAIYSGIDIGQKMGFVNRVPPEEVGHWKEVANEHGGAWHYCGSLIWLQRALTATTQEDRVFRYNEAVTESTFSYSRTDDSKIWKAEMGTTLAKAYRGLGDTKNAKRVLKEVTQKFPEYYDAYTVLAIIFRDEKNFKSAKEELLTANSFAKNKSSEVLYFLGLVSLDLGDVPEAKKYAEMAYGLGYPLPGLRDKLKNYK